MAKPSVALGVFFSFVPALVWSSLYVAARYLMNGETPLIDPITLSCLRFATGGGIIFLICLCAYRKALLGIRKAELLRIAFLSLFALTGMSIGLLWAPMYTTATNTAMIMSLSPIFIMLLGTIIGERLTWCKILGIIIATVGSALVIKVVTAGGFTYDSSQIAGDLIALGASISWSIGAILGKKMLTPGNDLVVTSWSMLFSSLTILLIIAFRTQEVVIPTTMNAWLVVSYIIIFPTVIGFCAWNAALSRVSLNVVSVMQYLSPVITMFLAYVMLGESLTWLQAIGAVLALSGVMIATVKPNSHKS